MEGGGEVDVDALTEQLELLRQLQEQGRELNERARSTSSNEEDDWDDEDGDDAREQFTSGASRFSEPQQAPGGELKPQEQWALSPRRGPGVSKQLGAAGGGGSASENVRVVLRVRPPLAHELNGYLGVPYRTMTQVSSDGSAVTLCDPSQGDDRGAKHSFAFDHIYDQQATQQEVYDTIARPLVASCLEGYNATILAYGQTGTGKTYTMEGEAARFEDRGIMPRAIEQIFGHIQEKAVGNKRFLVRASYLQIYNDLIYDLLKPESYNLQIREDDKTRHDSRGVYVDGLSEWVVRSPQEVFKLIAAGRSLRATGKTKLNELSSRSHAILRLIVEQVETSFGQAPSVKGNPVKQRFRVAKLNLVDLAGSERVRISGATGQRLEESRKINRSLSALGNVISALTDQQGRTHIPYRDSKLTRILEDSLGGNCRTAMIAMVSPAYDATSETLSTLKFANRAKNIRNKAFVNEDVDKNSLLRKYERELKRLRKELRHKSQSVVDQRVVLELEDQKRRAEADKMAALRALESRSFEFMQEKQAKRKLEEKISQLESQMLIGGHLNGKKLQDTPQFRTALDAHRNQIRKEYKEKLDDLEKEREQIGAQRAQVDRYKQLLLKQRDIMVALTQRLNERDEQIETLQDELEEVNRDHFKKQEQLDRKTTEVIHLQRINCELEQQQKQPEQTDELTKEKKETQEVEIEVPSANGSEQPPEPSPGPSPGQIGLEARVRALTCQYQSFRDEMTSRLGKKDSQVRQLLEENAALRLQDNRELQKEVEQHRQRSINHAKEISAMGTIMEKIHVLTLNVLSHSDTVDPEVKPQLQALSSLVSASVAALRNSKSTFGNNPTDPVTKG